MDNGGVSFSGQSGAEKSKRFGESRFGDSRFVESRFSGSLSLGKPQKARRSTLLITVTALLITALFITLAFLLHVNSNNMASCVIEPMPNVPCSSSCKFQLVETIPDVLKYPSGSIRSPKIIDNLMKMVASANKSIDVASSYWTLRRGDVQGGPYKEESVGEELFDALVDAAKRRGVSLRIVQQVWEGSPTQDDTLALDKLPNVEVRTLNMTRLINGGIAHTKMWIVDGIAVYVGSANTDWRSFTVVKEVGVVADSCPCVAADALKIFDVFWMMAQPDAMIPKVWPADVRTTFSEDHPITVVDKDNVSTSLYLTSSPPQLCPPRRTPDIDGLLRVISTAKHFVYIAVMDYVAATLYINPNRYWGVIDNALRSAAFNQNVSVKLLASSWEHSPSSQLASLKSLQDFSAACQGTIEVKLFTFPKCEENVPFSCVNHNKYMVTDNAAFIGTSNWSADYFISTTGMSMVFNSTGEQVNEIVANAQQVFERDWMSTYAKTLV